MLPFQIDRVAPSRSFLPRRLNKAAVAAVATFCLCTIVVIFHHVQLAIDLPFGLFSDEPDAKHDPNFPPLYKEYYKYERNLPQHDLSLPFPEGATGRYLYPANHVWGMQYIFTHPLVH